MHVGVEALRCGAWRSCPDPRNARSEAKRERIVECAMRQFAEHGYQGAKMEDIACELGIAKGSIFQHFGSKQACSWRPTSEPCPSSPRGSMRPTSVGGGVLRHRLVLVERTEHLVAEDWIPYGVVLIGNYGTDLDLKRDIGRFMVSEDPYGTLEFVEFGSTAARSVTTLTWR